MGWPEARRGRWDGTGSSGADGSMTPMAGCDSVKVAPATCSCSKPPAEVATALQGEGELDMARGGCGSRRR
jgi:hypothetical protein